MQYGTAREYATDIIENVIAVLVRERDNGRPYGDLVRNLRKAEAALDPEAPWGIDERGVFDNRDHGEAPLVTGSGVTQRTVGRIREREDDGYHLYDEMEHRREWHE